ncbi:ABC transporter permease [Cohnella cellulosilytica]|uniref:ABC transporter permease n=1 Tax=Cohnella cellulosilytica TaxID=986710 RepID=A0ABW2FHT5_9BACL
MHSLYASLRNEVWKLALKKKNWFFLLMTLAIPVGAGILLANFQSGFGLGVMTSGDYPIAMLGLFTGFLLPLFVFMGAADQFSGEHGDRTMKNALTRPISRFKVFASKQAALGIAILVYLLAALVGSSIASLFLSGSLKLGDTLDWLIAYGAAFLPLLALGVAAAFLAQFFSSGIGALAASILLYVALRAGAFFFPQLNSYSPTAYLNWHTLWLGDSLPAGQIGSVFMFLAACCILLFTAGFYFFDKKEL